MSVQEKLRGVPRAGGSLVLVLAAVLVLALRHVSVRAMRVVVGLQAHTGAAPVLLRQGRWQGPRDSQAARPFVAAAAAVCCLLAPSMAQCRRQAMGCRQWVCTFGIATL